MLGWAEGQTNLERAEASSHDTDVGRARLRDMDGRSLEWEKEERDVQHTMWD